MTSSLKFEITVYFSGFLCQSIRVTEEDRLSETAVWPTLFLLNVSTALKGTHNYIFIGFEGWISVLIASVPGFSYFLLSCAVPPNEETLSL